MKDLVSDANFECSPQAMETSHVALVQMTLRSDGFAHFRCDRNISMGEPSAHISIEIFLVFYFALQDTLQFDVLLCRDEPWQHVKVSEVRGK